MWFGIVDLLVLGLAVSQIVETWHHGSIFADWRARLELSNGFFAELLSCSFCLSHWVAGAMVLWWFWVLEYLGDTPARLLLCWPIYGFAVTRAAQLINDLSHAWCRTPRASLGYDFPEQNL